METFTQTVIINKELIICGIAIAVVIACFLVPCQKEKDDSELHSRNRYRKTAELDEQLKNDDQIFLNP